MSTEMQTKVQANPAQNFAPVGTGLLQRKSALCNTPGLVEDSGRDTEKLTLQRSSVDQAGITTVPPIMHEVLSSSGQPLDVATRAFMEPQFGHDFSKVRVHTDAKAAESARRVNALAFAVGHDIVFGTGRYAPETIEGKKLLSHELKHVVQQNHHNNFLLQRFTIDGSCSSPDKFPAEHQGNWECQDGTRIQNGTVYQLSYAELPNRCPDDKYSKHSHALIDLAVQKAITRISSNRPPHCLIEEEFQRGVLEILKNTTIRCESDSGSPGYASILSNFLHLRHSSIHGDNESDIEYIAGTIFHEALHVWEGRFWLLQHTGIVTPCTAACFPDSGQSMVNRNPNDCIMPPLVKGTSISVGLKAEATRGGGMGVVISYRYNLFTTLQRHLNIQLGLDVSYEHLFSSEGQKRYGSNLFQIVPVAGFEYRPSVLDRKGLVFKLEVGPSTEINLKEIIDTGFRFNLGAGLEFDFLYLGAGLGTVIPLSNKSETILDLSIHAAGSF